MNIVFIAISSFMLALSGALVPGPLFTITVTESVKKGFRAGPLIILGHGLLEILIVFLLVFEITPFLSAPGTRLFISITGGIMLIIMGMMLLKDAGKTTLELSGGGRQHGSLILTGIVGSISNPYWIVWWVTIGLGYLISSLRYGIAGVIAFYIGHITADLVWYSVISCAVSKGRGVIGPKGYRYTLCVCGVFLIIFGCWFLSAAPTMSAR